MGTASYFSEWKVIPLNSTEGEALLNQAAIQQKLLMKIFSVQSKMGYCGIQSAALLMSARHIGKEYPSLEKLHDCDVNDVPYSDKNMFLFDETTRIVNNEVVLKRGASLDEIKRLLQSHGVPTTKFYAHDIDADTFRSKAIEALTHSDSSQGVMINYLYLWKTEEGVVRLGHFSPLAAYHRETDRFLLMDVWYDGQSEWVETGKLFESMNTSDPESNISRGFLISGLQE